jgi:hypothetical protein
LLIANPRRRDIGAYTASLTDRGLVLAWAATRPAIRLAGLEVALELGAKRSDLVGPGERVHALVQAALGCCPVLVERVLVGRRYPGRDYTRA